MAHLFGSKLHPYLCKKLISFYPMPWSYPIAANIIVKQNELIPPVYESFRSLVFSNFFKYIATSENP